MSNIFARGVQSSWVASFNRASNRFIQGILAPERTQLRLLRTLLVRNCNTAFGRDAGFRTIAGFQQWQDRVPISTWHDLRPWLDRVEQGESSVLTREPVLFMERSAGTAGEPKLVPYTRSLLEDIALATGSWLFDTYLRWPNLRGTKSYWSVATSGPKAETKGGVPIGPDHDASLFGPVDQWAYERVRSAPLPLTPEYGADAWRFHTALNLLRTPDLGLMSCWSPSFLVDLMDFIDSNLSELLAELDTERREAVEERLRQTPENVADAIWPKLTLISCWGDAQMEMGLRHLDSHFPGVSIQTKGLMNTEAVISVPFGTEPGTVCALTSHVFEFEDLAAPAKRPRLLHQLEPGAHYVPIVSTSGGLYRYRTGDVIRCLDLQGETPRIVFEGRVDHRLEAGPATLSDHACYMLLSEFKGRVGAPLSFCSLLHEGGTELSLILDGAEDNELRRQALRWLTGALATRGWTLKTMRQIPGAWDRYRRAALSVGTPPEEVTPQPFITGEPWLSTFMRHDAASTPERCWSG